MPLPGRAGGIGGARRLTIAVLGERQVRPLWLRILTRRGRVDGHRLAGCGRAEHTGCMYPSDESHEERLDRQRREHEKFMKQLRRERYSMFVLLFGWFLYMCIIPFTTTFDQILLLFSIFLLCVCQFFVVMLMK